MPVEFTIIDGYNLLRSVGFLRSAAKDFGPGALLRARRALIGFLKQHQPEALRVRTTLVFDSKTQLGDLPNRETTFGIEVLFATQYNEADELIERLIKHHSAPKQLTVVSSDQRLKAAATKRGAKSINSEDWFDQLHRHSQESSTAETPPIDGFLDPPISSEETHAWLETFNLSEGDVVSMFDEFEQETTDQISDEEIPISKQPPVNRIAADLPAENNPFPQEYLDKLLEDLEDD